jgi:hypothetical protein
MTNEIKNRRNLSRVIVFQKKWILVDAFLAQSLCSNTICREVLSPDRQLKAVIFERECGATTAISTQISILKAAAKPKKTGNVFIIASTYGLATDPVVKVNWRNNRTLEIEYSLYSKVYKSESHPVVDWDLFRNEKVDVEFRTSKAL